MIGLSTWLPVPTERFCGTEAAMVAAPNAKEIAMAKSRKQTSRKAARRKGAGC